MNRAEKYAALEPGRDIPRGHLANAYFALASVQCTQGDWDRANEQAEHALSLWRAIKHPGVISVHRPAREQAEALTRGIAAHRAQ